MSGAIAAYEAGNLAHFYCHRLPSVIDNYSHQLRGTAFEPIGWITPSTVLVDWGAVVLLLGTLISVGVAVSVAVKARAMALAERLGAGHLIVLIAYQVVLFRVPYLKLWPSLAK